MVQLALPLPTPLAITPYRDDQSDDNDSLQAVGGDAEDVVWPTLDLFYE